MTLRTWWKLRRPNGLPFWLSDGAAVVISVVPAGVQLSTYRIAQEALTNVLKHMSSAAELHVSSSESRVEIAVSDPGPAHPSPGHVLEGGHGLIGMRERVALFGGTLRAGPRPEGGFAGHATIPFADPPPVVHRAPGREAETDGRAEPT